jgi:hypothetical protein
MSENLFGPSLGKYDIEQAVTWTLQKWEVTYLAEIERRWEDMYGDAIVRSLPQIHTWTKRNKLEVWPEESLPLLLVVCPGLADEPAKEGRGRYRAKWRVSLAVIAGADTEENTQALVNMYGQAFRMLLLQRPSLDNAFNGRVRGVEWINEQYDELPIETERSTAICRLDFNIEVGDVVSTRDGPVDPSPDAVPEADPYEDPGDRPEVETVHVEAEPKED